MAAGRPLTRNLVITTTKAHDTAKAAKYHLSVITLLSFIMLLGFIMLPR
jgi:hypothetical protein